MPNHDEPIVTMTVTQIPTKEPDEIDARVEWVRQEIQRGVEAALLASSQPITVNSMTSMVSREIDQLGCFDSSQHVSVAVNRADTDKQQMEVTLTALSPWGEWIINTARKRLPQRKV